MSGLPPEHGDPEEVRVGWSLAGANATEDRVLFTETVEVSKLL